MKWPLAAGILLLSLLLLAGCRVSADSSGGGGSTSGTSGTGTPPTLTCASQTAVHPVDTLRVKLTCAVAHAPSNATSFTVHYTVVDKLGHQRTLGAPCTGRLSGGSGSCTETFSLPIPLDPSKATVSGTLQPGGQPLGPVVPQQQPAPAGTPPLPLS